MGETPKGTLSGLAPILRRFVGVTSFREMMGKEFKRRRVVRRLQQRRRDTLVASLTFALEKRLIRGVAHQGMLEFVLGRGAPAPIDQSRLDKACKILLQGLFVLIDNPRSPIQGK